MEMSFKEDNTLLYLCESPDTVWLFFDKKKLRKQSNQMSLCEVADVFQKNMKWDGAQDKEIHNNKVTPSLESCTSSVNSCSKAKSDKLKTQSAIFPPVISTIPHLSIYLAITHQFSLKFKIRYKA